MAANTNTSAKFQRCQPKTAQWEGGWSNNAKDPGGPTMGGVTQPPFDEWCDLHGYPRRPVATITRAEAEQLFFDFYWMKAGCEGLFPGVDLATYDASVNSGVSRGRGWLLASLDPNNDHVKTVKRICAKRLGFVQSLSSLWKEFGKGWGNRIADIEATGVAWALAATNDNAAVVQHLNDEAGAATQKSNAHLTKAGTAGAGGVASGGGLVLDPATTAPMAGWVLGGMLVLALALAIYFVSRAVINAKRAKAYSVVAQSTSIAGAL